jgi:hypothetical protein
MRLRLPIILATSAALLSLPAARAQVLARPGWAGSGITSDLWWSNAVFYQIDPLSFQDSNGDGFGDLKGIADRLDYLQELGVDAIVLSPLTPHAVAPGAASPSGAQVFDPAYGSNEDFDTLVQQASARKIRVVVDLPLSGAQPIDSLLGVTRFWLSRGVAGLRLVRDAGDLTSGVAPLTPYQVGERIREIKRIAASYAGQRILVSDLVAESQATPVDLKVLPAAAPPPTQAPTSAPTPYSSRRRRRRTSSASAPTAVPVPAEVPQQTQLATQPQLEIDSHIAGLASLHAAELRQALALATQPLHAPGPVPILESDTSGRQRSIDRYGDGKNDLAIARILATVLLANRAATMLYFGQEIGMATARQGNGGGPGGDPAPMQWGGKPGFTTGTPWLNYGPNAAKINVALEETDPFSLLQWYRQLSALHHGNPVMRDGATTLLQTANPDIVAWARRPAHGEALPVVIVCNLSAAPVKISLKEDLVKAQLHGFFFRTMLRSGQDAITSGPGSLEGLSLPPYGVYIGELRIK